MVRTNETRHAAQGKRGIAARHQPLNAARSRKCRSLCWLLLILLLVGCNPEAGSVVYEVIYPSGYTKDARTNDQTIPVEGTSYALQWEKSKDYEKTHSYQLQILDKDGTLLYEYPALGHTTMRGALLQGSIIWVCSEQWTSPLRNGYLEGWLKESTLLMLDLSNGEILFQGTAGENEFYLASNETQCYFYSPGTEGEERLFGLMKTPPQNAELFYRELSDWGERHTLYTFDYVTEPDMDTSGGVETRVKFYPSQERLKLVWTSYEPGDDGGWTYREKAVYDVPLHTDSAESTP